MPHTAPTPAALPNAPALGIDFGTSNSVVAAVDAGGNARPLPVEGDATTLPTAVFFNAEDKTVHYGREAMALYLAGTEGRLMRSLKSLLGTPLMDEHTAVGWGEQKFQDIIARFLGELAARARAHAPGAGRRVVLGRPVHFVDDAPQRDRQAQDSLAQAAASAGFEEVSFELEPIAAAFDYERRLDREALALVVDIGGGTSDFSVVRLGPARARLADRGADILATAGVHIGGTDFDRRLSLAHVMPLLGLGHAGPQGREVPSGIFFDLATWHLINFQYQPRVLRAVQELRTNYAQPQLHARLMTVLRERLGHRLASEVEHAKISCSVSGHATRIMLDEVEAGLSAPLEPARLAGDLDALLARVVDAAGECLRRAGLAGAAAPDAIYLTGGSSALATLQARLAARWPGVPLVQGDLFGGVAAGLAYTAQRRYGA
ncbi:Hsp70 family protein [Ramlibacter sp. MAHUQ-53]|uniref:Hsp70 family protein n=1 Tax=unclassified Ramlibacter TaxID=2617605 RepID=UPI00362F605A